MGAPEVDTHIIELLPLLGEDEKTSILSVMQSFLKLKETTEVEPPFDLDEYNRELDESDAAVARGEYITQEEVEKYFSNKWKHLHGQ